MDIPDGAIFVWLGKFASRQQFDSYFKESYEERRPLNKFAYDFEIGFDGRYDHDFIEQIFEDEIKTPTELLNRLSWSKVFAGKAAKSAESKGIKECNTVVMLSGREEEYEVYGDGKRSPLVFVGRFYIIDNECTEFTDQLPTELRGR